MEVKISSHIKKIFESTKNLNEKRAKNVVRVMEDPIQKLIKIINN